MQPSASLGTWAARPALPPPPDIVADAYGLTLIGAAYGSPASEQRLAWRYWAQQTGSGTFAALTGFEFLVYANDAQTGERLMATVPSSSAESIQIAEAVYVVQPSNLHLCATTLLSVVTRRLSDGERGLMPPSIPYIYRPLREQFASNFSAYAVSAAQVDLYFSTLSDPAVGMEGAVDIEWMTTDTYGYPSPWTPLGTFTGVSSASHAGLTPNQSYSYRIRDNLCGQQGEWAGSASATTPMDYGGYY